MNWTNYLFAFYVFILAAALVYIWTKASKGKLDERIKLLEEKQRELIVLQNDTKEAIMVFETYMYEAKENLDTEREKIQFLIDKFEDMLAQKDEIVLESTIKAAPEVQVEISGAAMEQPKEDVEKGDLYSEIDKLSKKGYSIDEIVKKLGISKGEANFILGISK